jgi:hypothetical protein
VNGYVNVPGTFAGWFPPGVFSFTGAVRAVRNLAEANALSGSLPARNRFAGARLGN